MSGFNSTVLFGGLNQAWMFGIFLGSKKVQCDFYFITFLTIRPFCSFASWFCIFRGIFVQIIIYFIVNETFSQPLVQHLVGWWAGCTRWRRRLAHWANGNGARPNALHFTSFVLINNDNLLPFRFRWATVERCVGLRVCVCAACGSHSNFFGLSI